MSFPEEIDLVVYINLDKREDRRKETEEELKRVGVPESKVLRWSAVYREGRHTRGSPLGCTMSHVQVLQHVDTLPPEIQTVLILEDDFSFNDDVSEVHQSLQKFLTYPRDLWDVVLLTYHVQRREDYDDFVSKALYSHGTAGYLVNRSGLKNLLRNFQESQEGLLSTGEWFYVLDIHWQYFMSGGKCFYFNKSLGYQRLSYSDIQGAVITNPSRVG